MDTQPPQEPHDLGVVFAAVADPTRRAILARLAEGTATVSELAAPFAMSLPAVSKHLKVLERAGLLERRVQGRVHHCAARLGPLMAAEAWIARRSAYWDSTLDSLSRFLGETPKAPPRRDDPETERGVAVVVRDAAGDWQIERIVWPEPNSPHDPHPTRR